MTSDSPPAEEPDPLQLLAVNVVTGAGRILWDREITIPDRLWHYTDAAGALGILGGRALWATHVLFMNDASELRLAYPLLEDALDAAGERFRDNELVKFLTVACSVMISRQADDPDIYAVCFCEDGDLLSQWRAYGVIGSGYALGFDGPRMGSDTNATYGLSLSRVVYEPERQRDLATQLVERTILAFLQHMKEHPGDADNALPVAARHFRFLAQAFAYHIKDAAFREEREWRLIYARDPSGPVDAATRHFRSAARGLIPYVSIPMGVPGTESRQIRLDVALASLPVREVRVGPTAHPELATLAMQYLLGDLRLDGVEVTPSSIPLRA